MKIGPFEIEFSDQLEAYKRIDRAMKIKTRNIVEFDKVHSTAVIIGSKGSTYSVAMTSCECFDFSSRRSPCKHMYRLAMALGYDFGFPEFDPSAAAEYDVSDDISRIWERWEAGQLTFDAFIKCVEALKSSAEKAK